LTPFSMPRGKPTGLMRRQCPLCPAGSIGQRNTLIFSKDGVWT
jgi:hypothetical protein